MLDPKARKAHPLNNPCLDHDAIKPGLHPKTPNPPKPCPKPATLVEPCKEPSRGTLPKPQTLHLVPPGVRFPCRRRPFHLGLAFNRRFKASGGRGVGGF